MYTYTYIYMFCRGASGSSRGKRIVRPVSAHLMDLNDLNNLTYVCAARPGLLDAKLGSVHPFVPPALASWVPFGAAQSALAALSEPIWAPRWSPSATWALLGSPKWRPSASWAPFGPVQSALAALSEPIWLPRGPSELQLALCMANMSSNLLAKWCPSAFEGK